MTTNLFFSQLSFHRTQHAIEGKCSQRKALLENNIVRNNKEGRLSEKNYYWPDGRRGVEVVNFLC